VCVCDMGDLKKRARFIFILLPQECIEVVSSRMQMYHPPLHKLWPSQLMLRKKVSVSVNVNGNEKFCKSYPSLFDIKLCYI